MPIWNATKKHSNVKPDENVKKELSLQVVAIAPKLVYCQFGQIIAVIGCCTSHVDGFGERPFSFPLFLVCFFTLIMWVPMCLIPLALSSIRVIAVHLSSSYLSINYLSAFGAPLSRWWEQGRRMPEERRPWYWKSGPISHFCDASGLCRSAAGKTCANVLQ